MLDKKTWELNVLPEMAFRMGLDVTRLSSIPENDLMLVLSTLPSKPLVSETEWKLLHDYFLENAPDTLLNPEPGAYSLLQQFSVSPHRLPVKNNTLLTMISYDALNKNFLLGTRQGILYKTTPTFMLLDSFPLGSSPSDILFEEGHRPLILCMGNMDPNDQPSGSVNVLADQAKESLVVIDSLKRPVDFKHADFNNDGQQDLIVSAFGHFTGGLFAYENEQGHYIKHVIHSFSGTRKTIVRDFNDDGLPDILALISQGDEHIALFSNRWKFKFSYQVLMKFPPVYGSSYFELVDFNGDGHSDILYTNGDNADYSPVLKPYHGVRIFLNDGLNQFSELLFHPMHGASMAKGADFDQDGDIDTSATILSTALSISKIKMEHLSHKLQNSPLPRGGSQWKQVTSTMISISTSCLLR